MDNLQNLKDNYNQIKTPDYLIYNGWQNIKFNLGPQKGSFFSFYFKRAIILTSLIVILTIPTTISVFASKPGNVLYPIKRATENAYASITGNDLKAVQYKVQDIIDNSKDNSQKLDKAVNDYTNTIDNTNLEDKSENQKDDFKKALNTQEQKLKNIQAPNMQSQEKIDEAIRKTQEIQGEIKGDKDSNNNNNYNSQEHRNTNSNNSQSNSEKSTEQNNHK